MSDYGESIHNYISFDPYPFGWIVGGRLLFNASRRGSIYMPLPPVPKEGDHTFSEEALRQASRKLRKLIGWPMYHREVEA